MLKAKMMMMLIFFLKHDFFAYTYKGPTYHFYKKKIDPLYFNCKFGLNAEKIFLEV